MWPNWNDNTEYPITVEFDTHGDACTYAFDRHDRHNMEWIENDIDDGLVDGPLVNYYPRVYLGPYEPPRSR